jgi:hypothetical protein
MTAQNLDAACAKLGAKLASSGDKDTENSITKALGVLEEQGVYALFLYLHAREKQWGPTTSDEIALFLRQTPSKENALLGPNPNNGDVFAALQALAADLDKLLFARDLLHRALVYARYHAKAAQAGGPRSS